MQPSQAQNSSLSPACKIERNQIINRGLSSFDGVHMSPLRFLDLFDRGEGGCVNWAVLFIYYFPRPGFLVDWHKKKMNGNRREQILVNTR